MRRAAGMLLAVGVAVAAVSAQERIDEKTIARIKMEGFQHSQAMDTLSRLADVHGPRLTGSSRYRQAAEWARAQLEAWGLSNAHLETWGVFGRGWALDRFSVEMTAPQYNRLIASPKPWSSPTDGTVKGSPVLVEIASKDDFAKYAGKLRGAIVMNGKPSPPRLHFDPDAKRLTDQELGEQAKATAPGAPKDYWEEEDEWLGLVATQVEISRFFRDQGVAVLLEPSTVDETLLRVSSMSGWKKQADALVPSFVVAKEQYGRIVRLLDRAVPVSLEISLQAHFEDQDPNGYDVIAELPGTDPARRDEVVMLGGHLDSWMAGTGATDDGTGCVAAMEAMRILAAIGAKPRRTIRVALWDGEEEDYNGSLGYVRQHFGDPATMVLKPEHAKLSAYYNLDAGAGRIRGVRLLGNEGARHILEAFLTPLGYAGVTTVSARNSGGSDQMSFDAVGLPAFSFIQDPLDYNTRVHHTNMDVYESVIEADLQQAAVVMASVVYHTAMRDERMPRKAMPRGKEQKK